MNDAFTAIWAASEVLVRSPRLLQADDVDQAELTRIRTSLDVGEVVRVEALNPRKDGGTFFVEIEISPLHDADGRLTHFVAVQRETTDRRHSEDGLRGRLLRDESTGLLNLAGLEQALAPALATGRQEPSTLLLCKIEGLGRINNTLGRASGDAVVREVGRRLTSLAGERTPVARIESGEFALLLPGTTLTGLIATSERLRRAMLAPVDVPERSLVVTVSTV